MSEPTVTVRFNDKENLYYVKDGLMGMSVGWVTTEKLDPENEDHKKKVDHPLREGVVFDDEYFRMIMSFRYWSVKAKKDIEKELPMSDDRVKDYIDMALDRGWAPETSDNLRDDQNEEIKELDKKIQQAYGYEK